MPNPYEVDFPWGEITKIHVIGEHTIIEYVVAPDLKDAGQVNYAIDYHSFYTLDQALIGLLCAKYRKVEDFAVVARLFPGLVKE